MSHIFLEFGAKPNQTLSSSNSVYSSMSYLFQGKYSLKYKISKYEFKPNRVEYKMHSNWLDLFTSLYKIKFYLLCKSQMMQYLALLVLI